jgi:hypothetical protein
MDPTAAAAAAPKLGLLLQYLQRWLLAHDSDMCLLSAALQDVAALGAAVPGFAASATQVVERVQGAVCAKYGFRLALARRQHQLARRV